MTYQRRASVLLLAACLALFWACSAAPPPAPPPVPPPPPPSAASLDELSERFLARIEKNRQAVDDYESRKEQIVAHKLEDLKRQRGLRLVRLSEADTKRQKIKLWNEQLKDRKAQLAASADQGVSNEDAFSQDLERQIIELERQINDETLALNQLTDKARSSEAEIERLEQADSESLFLEEMQPLYREGIELHLGFYRGVMDLARDQLTPGEEAGALVDHFAERMAERDRLVGQQLAPDAFATLSHEFELDQRMSQAWLSALILEVNFALGAFRLESVSAEDRGELELLAESLRETWNDNADLVMYIDGHADSKQFRGQTPCVSATKNRQLSRLRAEAVQAFFTEQLGGTDARIQLDWYGNFSPHVGSTRDRRIELRVTARRGDGTFDSHRDYFAMRQGLKLGARTFRRIPGAWIESGCEDPNIAGREIVGREIEYLSDDYRQLSSRLGLDEAAASVQLDADQRQLEVYLGNAFTVLDGEECVTVRPCAEPSP